MSIVTTSSLKNITPYFSAIMVLVATLGLAACGGGGDSSSSKPVLRIDSPSVLEGGNSDSVTLVFTLTLSETATTDLSVSYTTADGSASETDNDYTADNGQATIAAGSNSTTISVTINGDTRYESDETLLLHISNPQGLETDNSSLTGTGTITNDDAFLSISSPSVNEGDINTADLIFTISLTQNATDTLTFDYSTSDDSAEADVDYTPGSGTLIIPAGNSSTSITIPVLGDEVFENDETLILTVNNLQGVDVSETGLSFESEGTIVNDEPAQAGYFAGNGTLNGTEYDDLIALVYGNRILMFSPTANVLYDIDTSNNHTSDGYSDTGNVDVYVNGQLAQTVDSTGSINAFELSGSISNGTGFGVGSFSVAFDQNNNTGAGTDFSRIEAPTAAKWTGDLYSVDTVSGVLFFLLEGRWGGGNGPLPACRYPSDVGTMTIPSSETNIFQLFTNIVQDDGCRYVGDDYTGFASVINVSGTDDGLLLALTNGSYAVFSIMDRPTP